MKLKKPQKVTFWVTNISNRNVSLTDLALNIKAFTSVNLMDDKHYYYTLAQLIKSAESGSIFKKRDKISVRKVPPVIVKEHRPIDKEAFSPTREKSVLEITEENYEELMVSDESFAEENAETAEMDTKPLIISKKE